MQNRSPRPRIDLSRLRPSNCLCDTLLLCFTAFGSAGSRGKNALALSAFLGNHDSGDKSFVTVGRADIVKESAYETTAF